MAVAEAGKKGAEESDLAVSFHVPDSLLNFPTEYSAPYLLSCSYS